MTGVCTIPETAAGLAAEAFASIDCLVASQAQSGHAALLAPGGSLAALLTAALTIYVAIFGYRLVLGRASLSLGEIIPHFIKIGILLALSTNWPTYQIVVFDLLFRGPEQLADGIIGVAAGPGGSHGGTIAAVQMLFDRLIGEAASAWSLLPPPDAEAPAMARAAASPGASPGVVAVSLPLGLGAAQFVSVLLWIAALAMLAASVGVLLVARIIVALLLIMGPLFILLALFPLTRGLFEGWLRTVVKFALVPLFALPLTAAMVAAVGPLTDSLGDAPVTNIHDSPVLPILLAVLVFGAVMAQAARLGGSIAGAIRLPRNPPQPAVGAAAPTSGTTTQPVITTPESRVELLIQSLGGADRGGTPDGEPGSQPQASRARVAPAPATAASATFDPGSRLGQGYRRLAVTAPGTGLPR